MLRIDHLIYGARDFETGLRAVHERLGVEPQKGGAHPEHGTINALIGLQDRCYLELLAPDPAIAAPSKATAVALSSLSADGLVTFAVASDDLSEIAETMTANGLRTTGLQAESRRTPDGQMLRWQTLRCETPMGLHMPFFIDWMDTPHPSETTKASSRLTSFTAVHPNHRRLRELYELFNIDVAVTDGEHPGLRAVFATQQGEVSL